MKFNTFNEWVTQNKDVNRSKEDFTDLATNKDLWATREEEGLLENQLDQWVNRLVGLLHSVPPSRKQELLEKVISDLQASIS